MATISPADAVRRIDQGEPVSRGRDNSFVATETGEKIRRAVIPFYNQERVHELAIAILQRLHEGDEEQVDLVRLARRILTQYSNVTKGDFAQTLQSLEIACWEREDLPVVQLKIHEIAHEKWQQAGFNERYFFEQPDFAQFVLKGKLHKAFRALQQDAFLMHQIHDLGGQPALVVNGVITCWQRIRDAMGLRVDHSHEHGETMILDGENQVWTYLGGGQGLVQHDPYRFETMKTFTTIDRNRFLNILEKGQRIERPNPEEEVRDCVLQVVSSRTKGVLEDVPVLNCLTSGFNQVIGKPRHPWFRVVVPEQLQDDGPHLRADVAIVGFGWEHHPGRWAAITMKGRFRNPDLWEFKEAEERVVTNIAVSQREVQEFLEFVRHHQHESGIVFNLLRQNCSVFVKEALRQILGIELDIEMRLLRLIGHILVPNFIRTPVRLLHHYTWRVILSLYDSLPEELQFATRTLYNRIEWIYHRFRALRAVPLLYLFGGDRGEEGATFDEEQGGLTPLLGRVRNWFSLKTSTLHLPALVQEWQLEQEGATDRIPNPQAIAISLA